MLTADDTLACLRRAVAAVDEYLRTQGYAATRGGGGEEGTARRRKVLEESFDTARMLERRARLGSEGHTLAVGRMKALGESHAALLAEEAAAGKTEREMSALFTQDGLIEVREIRGRDAGDPDLPSYMLHACDPHR